MMTSFVFSVKGGDYNLSRAKFRYYHKPQDDELLSSWLIRAAYLHLAYPETFIRLYLPKYKDCWWRDIDFTAKRDFLEDLAEKSNIDIEILYNLTLKAYEGYLAENIYPDQTQFIQPLGTTHRVKDRYGLRFCPLCLKEDEHPYFRKKWRLSFSTACIKHKCFLVDRCAGCGTSVNINRRHHDHDYPHCFKCGKGFRDTKPEYIRPDSYGLKAIKRLYMILDAGYFSFGDRYTYSFYFLKVIRHFSKIVYHKKPIKYFIDHEVMNKNISFSANKPKLNMIEYMPLKGQYLLFSGLMKVFEKFPKSFVEFCHANNLGKTEITLTMKYIPFWYKEAVNVFNKEKREISLEEVKNAIKYLKGQEIKVTKNRVGVVMGISPNFDMRKDILRLFGK